MRVPAGMVSARNCSAVLALALFSGRWYMLLCQAQHNRLVCFWYATCHYSTCYARLRLSLCGGQAACRHSVQVEGGKNLFGNTTVLGYRRNVAFPRDFSEGFLRDAAAWVPLTQLCTDCAAVCLYNSCMHADCANCPTQLIVPPFLFERLPDGTCCCRLHL